VGPRQVGGVARIQAIARALEEPGHQQPERVVDRLLEPVADLGRVVEAAPKNAVEEADGVRPPQKGLAAEEAAEPPESPAIAGLEDGAKVDLEVRAAGASLVLLIEAPDAAVREDAPPHARAVEVGGHLRRGVLIGSPGLVERCGPALRIAHACDAPPEVEGAKLRLRRYAVSRVSEQGVVGLPPSVHVRQVRLHLDAVIGIELRPEQPEDRLDQLLLGLRLVGAVGEARSHSGVQVPQGLEGGLDPVGLAPFLQLAEPLAQEVIREERAVGPEGRGVRRVHQYPQGEREGVALV